MSKDKNQKPASAFGRLAQPVRAQPLPSAPAVAASEPIAAPAAVEAQPGQGSPVPAPAPTPALVPPAPVAVVHTSVQFTADQLELIGPSPMPGMQAFHALKRAMIPYEQIRIVPEHLVRQVDQRQVNNLVRSIAWLGLFHPLLLDSQSELTAGLHRYKAIGIIKEKLPEVFERQFPNGLVQAVWIPCSFSEDPQLVKAYAAVENRHRKNFSSDQVRALIDQMRQDENVVQRRGRLAEGERSLADELSFVLHVSKSAAKRLLAKAGEVKNAPTKITSSVDRARTVHRQMDKLIGKMLEHLGPEHDEARSKIHSARAILGDVASGLRSVDTPSS